VGQNFRPVAALIAQVIEYVGVRGAGFASLCLLAVKLTHAARRGNIIAAVCNGIWHFIFIQIQ
jgi:hypothetical protein